MTFDTNTQTAKMTHPGMRSFAFPPDAVHATAMQLVMGYVRVKHTPVLAVAVSAVKSHLRILSAQD